MVVQLAVLVGTANPALLATLAWPLAAGGTAAALYAVIQTWNARKASGEAEKGRAFRISAALLFATLVAVIGFLATLARDWLGSAGAIAASSIAGFVDAHASSAAIGSMSASGQIDTTVASLAVLVALTTNTVTKAVLAFSTGPRSYRWLVCLGLFVVLAITWTTALFTLW